MSGKAGQGQGEFANLHVDDIRLDEPAPFLKCSARDARCATFRSRARRELGLASDVTLHVFRRDFISRLANDGHTSLPVLQRLVGHSDLATTATYVHEDPASMRAVMLRRAEGLSTTPTPTRRSGA